jgi:hypothetical protein
MIGLDGKISGRRITQQNRPTTSGMGGLNITNHRPDHPTVLQIDAQFVSGSEQHAGLRFSKRAIPSVWLDDRLGAIEIRAIVDAIDRPARPRQLDLHLFVNFLDLTLGQFSASHFRSIGYDDQLETRPTKFDQRLRHAGDETNLGWARDALVVLDEGAVPIQKDRGSGHVIPHSI